MPVAKECPPSCASHPIRQQSRIRFSFVESLPFDSIPSVNMAVSFLMNLFCKCADCFICPE